MNQHIGYILNYYGEIFFVLVHLNMEIKYFINMVYSVNLNQIINGQQILNYLINGVMDKQVIHLLMLQ